MATQDFPMGDSLPRVDEGKVIRWAKEARAKNNPAELITKLSFAHVTRHIVQCTGASAGFSNSLAEEFPDRFYLSNAEVEGRRTFWKHPRSAGHEWLVLWNNSGRNLLHGEPYCFIAIMLSNEGRVMQQYPE